MPAFKDWLDDSIQRSTHFAQTWMPLLARKLPVRGIEVPQDLEVHDNGLVAMPDRGDRLSYLWWHLTEREQGQDFQEYRALHLMQLSNIPLNARSDEGILAKMRVVLRGLYNAEVEMAHITAGIFSPEPLGILQCYGALGRGASQAEAAEQALTSAAAIQATLASAFPQIRLEPIEMRAATWINRALADMGHVLVAVGHPDPRENARGQLPQLGLDGGRRGERQTFSMQQNEIVMRGMAELKEDFLLLTLLSPVSLPSIAEMLAGLGEFTASWAAQRSGTRAFNLGLALPLMFTGASQLSAGSGYTRSAGENLAHTDSLVASQSHSEGQSQAVTDGYASSSGYARTETQGLAISQGLTETQGQSQGQSLASTVGQSQTQSEFSSEANFQSAAHTESQGTTVTPQASVGIPGVLSGGVSVGLSQGQADTVSQGSSQSEGQSLSQTQSRAETFGQSAGRFASTSESTVITESYSESETFSSSQSQMHSETQGASQTDTQGEAWGQAQTLGQHQEASQARGLSQALSQAMAVGLAPSLSLGQTNAWEFDPAIVLTEMLRQQQRFLTEMAKEGGYYVDVYGLTASQRGKQALMALIPAAFHGNEDVVTGVQTRSLEAAEEDYIRLHAKALTPSTRAAHIPELVSGYIDATLLTVLQTATYTSPALFEEGSTRSVQEAMPSFAFDPQMPGEVSLARQYSTERGVLSEQLLRLSPERHFHTAIAGDTGFGKSVTAERLAYETTRAWHYRTIILDFGQGWRRALNWQGLEPTRIDIRQLYPGAVRPMRWNPLQVPKRIDPGRYRTLVSDLFANAGRMGPRQLGFLREALTSLYRQLGVLVGDEEVQDSEWGQVRDADEALAINQARQELDLAARDVIGLEVSRLEPLERQALAVQRSKRAGLADWVANLRLLMDKVTRYRDANSRSSLQGVLLRLEPLAETEMQYMYGPGADTIAIEDLGLLGPKQDPWGVCVIEGGAEMEEFAKSALLALIASILYLDAVVRRRSALGGERSLPPMQIFFEEANKVLSGVQSDAASENQSQGQTNQTAHIFQTMWRDGRKYSIYLHVLAQTLSGLPPGILSSCNNAFFSQSKNDRDRQLVLAHLAKNNKGFVNADYDRFLGRMPIGMAVAKLGYATEMGALEPYLVQPLQLAGPEPSDAEIHNYFKFYGLA